MPERDVGIQRAHPFSSVGQSSSASKELFSFPFVFLGFNLTSYFLDLKGQVEQIECFSTGRPAEYWSLRPTMSLGFLGM